MKYCFQKNIEFVDFESIRLTFRMGYFWPMERLRSNTACSRPSKLQLLVVYFSRKHYQIRRGTYMGASCGIHVQLGYMGLFPIHRHIATHETKSPNFHHLFIRKHQKHISQMSTNTYNFIPSFKLLLHLF